MWVGPKVHRPNLSCATMRIIDHYFLCEKKKSKKEKKKKWGPKSHLKITSGNEIHSLTNWFRFYRDSNFYQVPM